MTRSRSEYEIAFYTVCNAAHYPGVVALLDSLRMLGEEAPFFVVDCGLEPEQREAISPHATIVPQAGSLHPALQKAVAPMAYPAEVMVVLDADVILNRPLTPLYEQVESGKIVAFDERIPTRFFPEWSELGVGAPVRAPYVTSGHFLLSATTAAEFFPLFVELQKKLDISKTFFSSSPIEGPETNPYFYADQDIFNAILCTRYDGLVVRLDHSCWSYPPFDGLRFRGLEAPFCSYADGSAPYLLHHFFQKPWLVPLGPSVYSDLFTMLTSNPNARLRLGRGDVPLRLRDSPFASLDRRLASTRAASRRLLRGRLGIRPRIERQLSRLRSP
jgi:hypothetical protein